MITFTANPAWPEIVANLLPGQTGMDRPDLVNRIFKIKLRELLKDLKSKIKQVQISYVKAATEKRPGPRDTYPCTTQKI